MTPEELRIGQLVYVTEKASVQFVVNPILFRIALIHHERSTYDGWIWLNGYQLDHHYDAVERREIWVQPAGLILVPAPRATRVLRRIPRNDPPAARVPRPRTTTENIGRTR